MDDFSDFASLLEGAASAGKQRTDSRLEAGQNVEALVLEVTPEWVFVDVGTPQDGRIERMEFGAKPPQKGDVLRVTVLDPTTEGARLTTALGHGGGSVDQSVLELAAAGGTPVHGEVVRAVKGGLEVKVGDIVAFCPASQVELGYASDLDHYVGQSHEFKVLELRDGGRSVVLSRRALLQDEARKRESELLATLKVGADVSGIVVSTQRHGALVDIGGATGYVHISELATHRVERVEDVLKEGEQVTVRVLSLEPGDKGLRIRLSLKQLHQESKPAPKREEILEATVSRALNHGILVDTPSGSGLVPLKELGLPPGADHRRVYPTGKTLRVVLLSRDGKDGKLRFSAVGVAGVEERRNYKEFSKRQPSAQGLGSLGDLFRQKLGLPQQSGDPEAAPGAPRASAAAVASSVDAPTSRGQAAAPPSTEPLPKAPPPEVESRATASGPDRSQELGVVRRNKRSERP